MKVAVVGGGSTYTPELVSGLTEQSDRLLVDELVMVGVDPIRPELVGGAAAPPDRPAVLSNVTQTA